MRRMKSIAVLVIVVLMGQPLNAMTQSPREDKASVKARLEKIPIGNSIEVKLLRSNSVKIKGKLMSVTGESFELQTVQSGKASTEKIAFADVESVKKSGMRLRYKVLIIVGVVYAAIAILLTAYPPSN